MASGSGWNIWVWLAGGGCGWNLWVWLVGLVVRRYIDFLILLIILYHYIGPGRLCSKHHLLFYSFIPKYFTYYAFQVAYYSCIIPSVCRGSHVQIE